MDYKSAALYVKKIYQYYCYYYYYYYYYYYIRFSFNRPIFFRRSLQIRQNP